MASFSGVASMVGAGLFLVASGSALAGPRAACDLMPLEQIRGLVGAPVSIFAPASSTPAVRGEVTIATCTYVVMDAAGHVAKGRSGKFSLMWAPQAKLQEANDFYVKRHDEAAAIKGDVLVLAWVGDPSAGKAGDWDASQKLLAAVLQKL